MKLHINKDQLITGLSRVIDATINKATHPILGAVLLCADGEQLKLSATSMDISASTSVKAVIAKDGTIALPAKRLMQVAKELPDGPLSIEMKSDRATIKSGSVVFQIAGYDAKTFPMAAVLPNADKLEATAAAIENMLASVAYAADHTSGQMSTFNGVFISIKWGKLSMHATDKKRIAVNSKTVDAKHEASCILPNATIGVLRRLLADSLSVSVAISQAGASFTLIHEGGTTHVQSAVIAATYPDITPVVARQTEGPYAEAKIGKTLLNDLLRRVSIVCDDLVPYCRFHFEPKKLTVYAINKSFGEAEDSVEIAYDGPVVDIGLKPKDLLDPIEASGAEVVSLSVLSDKRPCIIRGQDEGFLCLVAPIPLT